MHSLMIVALIFIVIALLFLTRSPDGDFIQLEISDRAFYNGLAAAFAVSGFYLYQAQEEAGEPYHRSLF